MILNWLTFHNLQQVNNILVRYPYNQWITSQISLQIYWNICVKIRLTATEVITVWKSLRIRSFSGPYFPAFGLNMDRYSECGKIWTRKTPNTDTFYAVNIWNILKLFLGKLSEAKRIATSVQRYYIWFPYIISLVCLLENSN